MRGSNWVIARLQENPHGRVVLINESRELITRLHESSELGDAARAAAASNLELCKDKAECAALENKLDALKRELTYREEHTRELKQGSEWMRVAYTDAAKAHAVREQAQARVAAETARAAAETARAAAEGEAEEAKAATRRAKDDLEEEKQATKNLATFGEGWFN